VLLLKFLQRRLLDRDAGVELVVLAGQVGGPPGRGRLLGLRRRERGLGQRELAGRGLFGRGLAALDPGQLVEILQVGSERSGRHGGGRTQRVGRRCSCLALSRSLDRLGVGDLGRRGGLLLPGEVAILAQPDQGVTEVGDLRAPLLQLGEQW
jgi:hypothetical protein